mgnify:CR=1 FL=1
MLTEATCPSALRKRFSGEVLTGAAEGRTSAEETTLFDSTGLAIQDLGIVLAVWEAWQEGRVEAPTAPL